MSIEDTYFTDGRIISKAGSKIMIEEIRNDFESFTGTKVTPQEMGNMMKKHGYESNRVMELQYANHYLFRITQTGT